MKYLVSIEGEIPAIFDSEEEAFQYIEEQAEKMKNCGVENTDAWVQDFKREYFSQQYCLYPDIIVPIDGDVLMKTLLN